MKEDQLFCVAQKAFIWKGDSVLTLNDPIEGLDFPGGKVQLGETDFSEALKREVKEETGLDIEVGDPFHVWYAEFSPEHRNYPKKVFVVGFRCAYRGGEVRLSDEHDHFRWVNKDTYHEVNDRSNFFEALEKYFGDR
ncbi:MAG: hypothetical protein A2939_03435 [Parcubacteria group bacterium RIFCSPLOWO2_01_FULL_48_18]|nr:MAG: hypothetical protein A3J67_03320 [Parcubacteria group bacterium RIFCSPHIGHO2_02_FULL_48_10b]OHB22834.1 MAG: hypothetical protein A2939_03435 [Parcubacteria group bacterium RIFCSPLOWO2_01_FULL_48_18]